MSNLFNVYILLGLDDKAFKRNIGFLFAHQDCIIIIIIIIIYANTIIITINDPLVQYISIYKGKRTEQPKSKYVLQSPKDVLHRS